MREILICLFAFFIGHNLQAQERIEKTFTAPKDRVLHIKIDVDAGELKVRSSNLSQEGKVYLSYTIDEFDGRVDFDQGVSRLRVSLKKERWFKSEDRAKAEALIKLPEEVDTEIRAKIKAGEVDIDLGGVRMRDFSLRVLAGEVKVDFSRPNPILMDKLYINAKIGETRLKRLGNANFKEAEIDGGIGELTIDFTGLDLKGRRAWVDLDIGETTILLPRGEDVRMAVSRLGFLSSIDLPSEFRRFRGHYLLGSPEEPSKGFFIKVRPGLGELRVELE